ncbi:MoaD/ThiS family protein [Ruficoccus amylovorans]|nr:MoaD/ThiS family protein [Ruficoccus amylovorans]
MMKQIKILYFGQLRQARGLAEETVNTPAETLAELFTLQSASHGLTLASRHLKMARNDEFCPPAEALCDGDTVAFLPPVCGG